MLPTIIAFQIFCATGEAPAIIAAIHPTFNAKTHRANLDRLTMAEYSIDESNEVFAIDDLGKGDSVSVRDGNSADYGIDNLTNRYNDRVDEGVKSGDTQPKMVAVPNGCPQLPPFFPVTYRLHSQREIDAT